MCDSDYIFDSSETETSFNGFVILPAKTITIVHHQEKGHRKENFSLFPNFIRDNPPNVLSVVSELDLWETYCIS